MQVFMKFAVTTRPARTVTFLEPHQPTSWYLPGGTENRYLAPERTVSDATALGPWRVTFTWRTVPDRTIAPSQAWAIPVTRPVDGELAWVVDVALSEYRIVLATMPFPANPMDTNTGFERPGTVTLRTRIEYAGQGRGTGGEAVEAEAAGRELWVQPVLSHCSRSSVDPDTVVGNLRYRPEVDAAIPAQAIVGAEVHLRITEGNARCGAWLADSEVHSCATDRP